MIKKLFLTAFFFLSALFFGATGVNAQVITITSTTGGATSGPYDQPTKIIRHNLDTLIPAWNTFGFDDSGWGQAYSVWSVEWWSELNWIPSGEPPDAFNHPQGISVCAWCFIKRSSGDHVIQATPNVVQGAMTRDFFRKKFTLPAGKTIKKAYLYVNSDNLSKFWVNGTGVFASNTSLNNYGDCSGPHLDGIEGFVFEKEVTSLITPGDNILTGNNLNTAICNQSHPMGVQFFLWIELGDVNGTISGVVFNDLKGDCDNTQSPKPGQAVNAIGSLDPAHPKSCSSSNPQYTCSNLQLDTYTLDAYDPSAGTAVCCPGGTTAACTVTISQDYLNAHRDIAFRPNISWLNTFDGDVYGLKALDVKIPSHDPTVNDNWLINKRLAFPSGGGTAITSNPVGSVSTKQLALAPNHSSVRGALPGWEVSGHPDLSYLTTFVWTSTYGQTFSDWGSLNPNQSYLMSAWTPPFGGTYTLSGNGVTTLWVSGTVTISHDLQSSNLNNQGLVIISTGNIIIDPSVQRVDAVLITQRIITIDGDASTEELLTINGGLYSLGDFSPGRKYINLDNRILPAITVRFQPVYLTNTNLDFIKYRYSWEELPPS